MVRLVNKLRQPLTLGGKAFGTRSLNVGVYERLGKVREATCVVPMSVTLAARGTKGASLGGLPDAVAMEASVAAAVKRGAVEIVFESPAPAVEPSPTPIAVTPVPALTEPEAAEKLDEEV